MYLFTAGIVPGLLLTFSYAALIVLMATFFPDKVRIPGASDMAEDAPLMGWGEMAMKTLPTIVLSDSVLNGTYTG